MYTLYTQPGCGPCIAVKRQLTTRNIPFELKDIRQDANALARVKELGYTGTPVLEAGDRHAGGQSLPSQLNAFLAGATA